MTQVKENHAFIDGQNLHSGVRALGWKIDHKKFRDYLRDELNVTKAFMFVGFMEEHQDLYNALQDAGFICFFKPLLRYNDGTVKGNVDADMVLQVMVDIDNFDKAVIVTGDGDFTGLIRHLITVNKLERVIIPNSRNFSSLYERIDEFGKEKNMFQFMDNLRNTLSYKPTTKGRGERSQQQNNVSRNTRSTSSKSGSIPVLPTKPSNSRRSSTAKPKRTPAKKRASNGSGSKSGGRARMTYKERLESSLIESINNAAE